jgi:hypothetical protein
VDSGEKAEKLGEVVKNEQRHRAECDRLVTVAAADLRLPEERENKDGLGAQHPLGPFLWATA